MDIANKTLKSLQSDDVLVDILTDHYDESLFGFIRDFNEDFLLLEFYNDDGLYDGIIILRHQDITRLRWGRNDTESILKLISRHNLSDKLESINISSIGDIIKSVDKAFKHINIKIQDINDDWSIIGQVEEMDGDTLILKEFGTMSSLDRGMLMLSISDITRIDAGGIYENNLLKIHQ
jgi:hypothetical protein